MMIKIFEKFNEPVKRVEYYDNGQKKSEFWYLNNKLHREDGPAKQWWFKNGMKYCTEWYLNHKSHRENGPAVQHWFENGKKNYEDWYLNGEDYSRDEWVEKLKKIGSPHYEEQRMLLDMEKYNI